MPPPPHEDAGTIDEDDFTLSSTLVPSPPHEDAGTIDEDDFTITVSRTPEATIELLTIPCPALGAANEDEDASNLEVFEPLAEEEVEPRAEALVEDEVTAGAEDEVTTCAEDGVTTVASRGGPFPPADEISEWARPAGCPDAAL